MASAYNLSDMLEIIEKDAFHFSVDNDNYVCTDTVGWIALHGRSIVHENMSMDEIASIIIGGIKHNSDIVIHTKNSTFHYE